MQKKLIAVAAALAMFATATPAFAAINSTKINIVTTNRGTIDNTTSARSHTGQNVALGSVGGSGGTGGAVTSAGSENNGGALGGNGGNGGNGGAGGLVTTGDATAEAGTVNDLNNTDAEVALDCACGDINSVTIDVITDNNGLENNIDNDTRAKARTGQNVADGSVAGNGGVGGVVDGGVGSENNGGARAGTGGAGGSGGLGGTIGTGAASSTAGTINMLNSVLLRVRL